MQRITRVAALVLVAIAIVLAVVAFGLGRHAAKPALDTTKVSQQTTVEGASSQQGLDVVVAAVELKNGAPINAVQLRVVKQPQQPAGSFSDVQSVAGSVPRVDIPADAMVNSALLVQGVTTALKPGERALAVPVDEQTGVGNRVRPGDYVDVFMSLKSPPVASFGKDAVDASQTRLLLSHLRVLAYGDQDLPSQPQESVDNKTGSAVVRKASSSSSREAPPSVPRTAVLAVPVEDADQLLLGVQNGRLTLALRPAGDDSQQDGSLFEQPRGVLATGAGLSAEQQQALSLPENRAYAGLNGSTLAGQEAASERSVPRRHSGAVQGIEIIRGDAGGTARSTRKDFP